MRQVLKSFLSTPCKSPLPFVAEWMQHALQALQHIGLIIHQEDLLLCSYLPIITSHSVVHTCLPTAVICYYLPGVDAGQCTPPMQVGGCASAVAAPCMRGLQGMDQTTRA